MLDRRTPPPFVHSTLFELIRPAHSRLNNGIDLYFVSGGSQEVMKFQGKLTIKGVTQDVTAPFTVKQDGASQVFEGALPIKRNAFHVGDGEWKDTSVVADDVTIKFRVVLAKK